MNSKDKQRQFILEFLLPYSNEINIDTISHLFDAGQIWGYTETDLAAALVAMDANHDGLLAVTYLPCPDGPDALSNVNQKSWISAKGDKYLYALREGFKEF